MRAVILFVLLLAGCFCGCSWLPADVAEDVREARDGARATIAAANSSDPPLDERAVRALRAVEDYSSTILWTGGVEDELDPGTRERNEERRRKREAARKAAGQ